MEKTPESPCGGGGSGGIWIILFGISMGVSVVSNLVLSLSSLGTLNRGEYARHLGFFALYLGDYSLLIFEFAYLGTDHVYPFGSLSCSLYQNALKILPILEGTLALGSLYAPFFPHAPKNAISILSLGSLALLSAPTLAFSQIIIFSGGKTFCEVYFGSRTLTSIYHLFYLSLLSYWVPLFLSIYPMAKLISKRQKGSDVLIALSTSTSYFLMYFLHAVVVTARYSSEIAGVPLTDHQIWMIKVAQSLTWLIAYFWHFVRPSLIIVLHAEIKENIWRWFFGPRRAYGIITQNEASLNDSKCKLILPLDERSFL